MIVRAANRNNLRAGRNEERSTGISKLIGFDFITLNSDLSATSHANDHTCLLGVRDWHLRRSPRNENCFDVERWLGRIGVHID